MFLSGSANTTLKILIKLDIRDRCPSFGAAGKAVLVDALQVRCRSWRACILMMTDRGGVGAVCDFRHDVGAIATLCCYCVVALMFWVADEARDFVCLHVRACVRAYAER
jgi:hypothetical protein